MRTAARAILTLLLAIAAALPCAHAERGDIVFVRKSKEGAEYPPATFSHAVHRYQYRCYVCHESIFKMKGGASEVSMDEIGKGKTCGVCHDETTAFGVTFETCARCHR